MSGPLTEQDRDELDQSLADFADACDGYDLDNTSSVYATVAAIVTRHRTEAAASALREAAAGIRLGLNTNNLIGKGAEMACRELDAHAASVETETTGGAK